MKKDPCAVFTGAGVFRTFSQYSLVQKRRKTANFRQNNESLKPVEVQGFHKWWTVQDSNL